MTAQYNLGQDIDQAQNGEMIGAPELKKWICILKYIIFEEVALKGI